MWHGKNAAVFNSCIKWKEWFSKRKPVLGQPYIKCDRHNLALDIELREIGYAQPAVPLFFENKVERIYLPLGLDEFMDFLLDETNMSPVFFRTISNGDEVWVVNRLPDNKTSAAYTWQDLCSKIVKEFLL